MNKKYKASRHYLMVGIFYSKRKMRGERVSRRRHKHLCEYTCCEQCSKSVAADGTYTCNRKTIIENYMSAEENKACKSEYEGLRGVPETLGGLGDARFYEKE